MESKTHVYTFLQCCVYGSGRMRNFCLDPDPKLLFWKFPCQYLFVCLWYSAFSYGRYPASYSCPVSGRNWDMQEAGFFGTFLTTCTGYLYCRLQYFNSFAIVFRFWTLCNIFILAALCTGEQHLCKDRELRKLFPSCQGSRVKLFFMSANCDQKFALWFIIFYPHCQGCGTGFRRIGICFGGTSPAHFYFIYHDPDTTWDFFTIFFI